ncbi:MAG: 2,3-bisphosphoglycerate-independent phosphoglycerate mutase, partial [Romboutsia sp.]|nr:2,3-bisphosphoglycerate-independent phosphoglycerate mutase [Romboutsia sp.]
EAIEKSYSDDKIDEFVVPVVMVDENGQPIGLIKENDSIVFGNFRPDRAREITRALVDTDFVGFERPNMNTFFVCLTTYDVTIKNVHVAFKPQSLENTLGEYLAKNGKSQLRTAETEKYAHVTFFFNGGVEEANEGEERLLVPSPKVATYDLQPEMNAPELTEKVLAKIDEDKYDFIVLNYANPDMVGHTGVVEAAIKAVETVDTCVGKVVDKIVSKGGSVLITADHGNAELMQDPETKTTITAHSTNPVPFIVVGEEFKTANLREGGRLSDIAPTVLDMMNLKKPEEMTGQSLIIK